MVTNRTLLMLVLALLVVIALAIYNSRYSALQVTREAAEQIEKAKQR